MLFKNDENLPVQAAEVLRAAGHDVMTVDDQGLAGHPDSEIAQVCQAEHRTLVTLDLDFADIREYPPDTFPGIIILRPSVQSASVIRRLLARAASLLQTEPVAGNLWIVDDTQIRIREGSPGNP